MTGPPRIFDRALVRRRLRRAARGGFAADFLYRRAAADLAERVREAGRDFALGLEVGARGPALAQAMAEDGKVGLLVALAGAREALPGPPTPGVVGDEESLPIGPGVLDLIVAPHALHWANDLVGALIQIRLSLRPGGLFLASLPAGVTLLELREALIAAEAEARSGAALRVSPFLRPDEAPSLLQRAGFAGPVVESEEVRVRYADPLAILTDLRGMGETAALAERPAGLSRRILARAMELYRERFADADGRFAATFEIVTLTGWAPG